MAKSMANKTHLRIQFLCDRLQTQVLPLESPDTDLLHSILCPRPSRHTGEGEVTLRQANGSRASNLRWI